MLVKTLRTASTAQDSRCANEVLETIRGKGPSDKADIGEQCWEIRTLEHT